VGWNLGSIDRFLHVIAEYRKKRLFTLRMFRLETKGDALKSMMISQS
jgi:hypothetical protein